MTGAHLSVWYCHQHQAFFASHSAYSETVDGGMRGHSSDSIECGPFDSFTDLLPWLVALVSAAEELPDLIASGPTIWTNPPLATAAAGHPATEEAEAVGNPGQRTDLGIIAPLSSDPTLFG